MSSGSELYVRKEGPQTVDSEAAAVGRFDAHQLRQQLSALLVKFEYAVIAVHRAHSRAGIYSATPDWRQCRHPFCEDARKTMMTTGCVDGVRPVECDMSSTGGVCDVCGQIQNPFDVLGDLTLPTEYELANNPDAADFAAMDEL